ncbi:MAG: nucleotidyltransferase domain-containing protein [Vulcanococcus sp.]
MPVRLLTQSLLRWPEVSEVLQAVSAWAAQLGALHPGLERVGVHGSYGRGDAGFGSDLNLVLIDAAAEGPQSRRYRRWPFETLPLSCDALVLTPSEWQQLIRSAEPDPTRQAFARALRQECRWLWCREAQGPQDQG